MFRTMSCMPGSEARDLDTVNPVRGRRIRPGSLGVPDESWQDDIPAGGGRPRETRRRSWRIPVSWPTCGARCRWRSRRGCRSSPAARSSTSSGTAATATRRSARTAHKMAEVWIAAIEEFDYDWAWLQVDDCFEFEPLGVGTPGRGQHPAGHQGLPARDRGDPARPPRARSRRPTAACPRSSRPSACSRGGFGDTVLVEGSCAAPYSSVGLLFGLEGDDGPRADRAGAAGRRVRFLRRSPDALHRGPGRGRGPCHLARRLQRLLRDALAGAVPAVRASFVHAAGREAPTPAARSSTCTTARSRSRTCWPRRSWARTSSTAGRRPTWPRSGRPSRASCCFSGNLDPIEVLMRGTPDVARETERIWPDRLLRAADTSSTPAR